MYERFFGFRDLPFRITPDPRFLYRSALHDRAIDTLARGIAERAGCLTLVGEVGTGKTLLVRHLLEALPATVRTVLLLHPTVAFADMLDQLLFELGIPVDDADAATLVERLGEFLVDHADAGGNAAVFFDEAQALATAQDGQSLPPAPLGQEETHVLAGKLTRPAKGAHSGRRKGLLR